MGSIVRNMLINEAINDIVVTNKISDNIGYNRLTELENTLEEFNLKIPFGVDSIHVVKVNEKYVVPYDDIIKAQKKSNKDIGEVLESISNHYSIDRNNIVIDVSNFDNTPLETIADRVNEAMDNNINVYISNYWDTIDDNEGLESLPIDYLEEACAKKKCGSSKDEACGSKSVEDEGCCKSKSSKDEACGSKCKNKRTLNEEDPVGEGCKSKSYKNEACKSRSSKDEACGSRNIKDEGCCKSRSSKDEACGSRSIKDEGCCKSKNSKNEGCKSKCKNKRALNEEEPSVLSMISTSPLIPMDQPLGENEVYYIDPRYTKYTVEMVNVYKDDFDYYVELSELNRYMNDNNISTVKEAVWNIGASNDINHKKINILYEGCKSKKAKKLSLKKKNKMKKCLSKTNCQEVFNSNKWEYNDFGDSINVGYTPDRGYINIGTTISY